MQKLRVPQNRQVVRKASHIFSSRGEQGRFSMYNNDVMRTIFKRTACGYRLVKAGKKIEKFLDVIKDRIAK